MTPEEKAKDLVQTFQGACGSFGNAVYGATLCCDEVLAALPMYTGNLNPTWKYWNDVKSEIELL